MEDVILYFKFTFLVAHAKFGFGLPAFGTPGFPPTLHVPVLQCQISLLILPWRAMSVPSRPSWSLAVMDWLVDWLVTLHIHGWLKKGDAAPTQCSP